MAKNTTPAAVDTDLAAFLIGVRDLINDFLGTDEAPEVETEKAPAKTTAKKSSKKSAPEPEPEDEDEDADEAEDEDESEEDARRVELEAMSLTALRKLAAKMGFDKDDVKDADKETLVESIIDDEQGSEDDDADEPDADEDAADDEDADESEEDVRAELEGLNLTAVKKVARETYGMTAADYKGLDKDGIIDLIIEELEADDADDADDADEDDENYEGYDEEELEGMSLKELKAIAADWELEVKAGTKKPAMIELILEAQDEEDDE